MGDALVKRKLVLEGLDCANCAMKIEKGVGELEGVSSCSVNFVTKTMTVETAKEKEEHVVMEAKQIVNKLEPHIHVKEEQKTKAIKETFLLEGLDCANCAMKIETKINEMPAVTSASVDFVSKKLRVEVANKKELETTIENIKEVVQRLEPEVEVVREKERTEDDHSHDHGAANSKKMIWRLSIGAILTAIAALASLPQIITIPLFLIAYIIIGGDIILRAVKNITRGQVFDENFLIYAVLSGGRTLPELCR